MNTTDTIHRLVYDTDPDVVRRQLARLKMTQAEAAALLRVDPRTMRRWLQEGPGSSPIPFAALAVLKTTDVPVDR